MKYGIFSIVTGTSFCTVPFKDDGKGIPQGCQFCVSGQVADRYNTQAPEINTVNFRKAIQIAKASGTQTVMLTSRGEPTLFPNQITEFLELLENQFPFIELQTNGIPLGRNFKKFKPYLLKWRDLGLSTISISVVSENPDFLRQNYTPQSQYIDLPFLIKNLRNIGFTVRLACVCTKPWMSTVIQLESFLDYCVTNNVGQVTLRPVNDEFRRESARRWIQENKLSEIDKKAFRIFLDNNGDFLQEIPYVGTVYDYKGVSVLLSDPLTRDSIKGNSEEQRNLIFFTSGEIRYDWEKEGAILFQGRLEEKRIRDGLKE